MVVITAPVDTIAAMQSDMPFPDLLDGNMPFDFDIDHHDSSALEWLPSSTVENDPIVSFGEAWDAQHVIADDSAAMWSEMVLSEGFDEWTTRSSSPAGSEVSSPTESVAMLFSSNSSDSDEIYDGEITHPVKRKAIDEDFEAVSKKLRQVKKASKPRSRDLATMKTIASLRANSTAPDTRRQIHNVLERKRRNDLKDSYEELREAIPDMASMDRAPTGQILQKAAEFIAFLQQEEQALEAGLAAARAENERLRRQMAQ